MDNPAVDHAAGVSVRSIVTFLKRVRGFVAPHVMDMAIGISLVWAFVACFEMRYNLAYTTQRTFDMIATAFGAVIGPCFGRHLSNIVGQVPYSADKRLGLANLSSSLCSLLSTV